MKIERKRQRTGLTQMINEEKWYIKPNVTELFEQDKQRQFEKYKLAISERIVQEFCFRGSKCFFIEGCKEYKGSMVIKFRTVNDGEGYIKVSIDNFFNDAKIIEADIEKYNRWNSPCVFSFGVMLYKSNDI